VTRLRKMMLEELQRRNYSEIATRNYRRVVTEFAKYFGKSPDKLGPNELRTYQAYLLIECKLTPGTVVDRVAALRTARKGRQRNSVTTLGTPLSIAEDIPWKCRQLVIGTGAYGRLPVMKEVEREAKRHKVKLLILPTIKAIKILQEDPRDTNAIIHVTC